MSKKTDEMCFNWTRKELLDARKANAEHALLLQRIAILETLVRGARTALSENVDLSSKYACSAIDKYL